MEKKKFQMPHTYIIIFGVILVAALLTCFIPLGKYDTKEITYTVNGSEKTRTVVDPDSFQYILDEDGNKVTQAAPLFGTEDFGGRGGIVNYVFEGMTAGSRGGGAVAIIAFTLVVGGAFGIVLRTGAVESGIMRVISLTNGKEIILIPILITLFSLGGAVFGMGEEAIPFVMILVPMFIAMGYDAVVGIMCSYVATQVGFGSSWQNPFGLAVAQGIAGIPVMSGMAQGIIIILGGTDASSGTVLNTILHSISGAMQDLPPVVSAWFMYVFQSVFNFFVVSGSGQAALTMPIMAPLADLVGVERQIAVLAFQLGDAFTNFIVPTSGCLLGALAAAKLEWGSWAKFQIKFQAVLVVFASLAVVLGVVIGLS